MSGVYLIKKQYDYINNSGSKNKDIVFHDLISDRALYRRQAIQRDDIN